MLLQSRALVGGLLATAVFIVLYSRIPISRSFNSSVEPKPFQRQNNPLHRRVALATTFGSWHFDVLVPFAWSFEIASAGQIPRLYVETPHHLGDYGFEEVIEQSGIFNGEQLNYTQLVTDMESSSLYPSSPGEMIEILVLGTCEFDLSYWTPRLLPIWEKRPDDQKFTIVCLTHDVGDRRGYADVREWSRRGAIRYVTLSEHVTENLIRTFAMMGDTHDPKDYNAMLEYIKVDEHFPLIPLKDPIKPRRGSRKISNVIIQGMVDDAKRDYSGTWSDMIQALTNDPALWGYLPPLPGTSEFRRDPDAANPFTLHVAGVMTSWLDLPRQLRNVVRLHRNLQYPAYYKLMQEMDVVLPAFSTNDYYETKASSTVILAVQCNVPIIAPRRFLDAYRWVADDRVVIRRPQGLRDIDALTILRSGQLPPAFGAHNQSYANASATGSWSQSLSSNQTHEDPLPYGRATAMFQADTIRMLRRGWERSNGDFSIFKKAIRRRNFQMARRILKDE